LKREHILCSVELLERQLAILQYF